MKSNEQVIKIAEKYLGKGGAIFRKFCGLPSGAAWCNAFVDYIANEGGVSSLYFNGKKETYCPNSISWCKKNLAEIPLYLALPADIIYFDWEKNGVPNHIGLVRARKSTDAIYTVEGNTDGGRVANKTRAGKYVQGVFRPHFVPSGLNKAKLEIDGEFGYKSVYMLQIALGMDPTGILDKATVKKLQAKGGTAQDGAWGPGTSKAVQKLIGAKPYDGQFGPESVKKLQSWTNAQVYKKDDPKPVKKGYAGTFPELPPKTAKIAVECAYAYKTQLSVYRYKGGKPKAAYKKRLNKEFPNRKGWKYPKSRAGASCDVFAGTVLRAAGYKKAPHAMSKFVAWCRKNLKAVKKMKNGDIVTRKNHIAIVVDLKGKLLVANAHYQTHDGTYGIIQTIKSAGGFTHIWRPSGLSYFSKGDTFTEIKHLKQFLNWYGNYGLDPNKYNIGNKTEAAINDFRTKEGLEPNGRFDEKALIKAKAVKK